MKILFLDCNRNMYNYLVKYKYILDIIKYFIMFSKSNCK